MEFGQQALDLAVGEDFACARSASAGVVCWGSNLRGQLGPFGNGYWGHPAMKLSPEVNLMAVAHYLQALEVQRKANKIVSILGSKTPHIQNVAVGGVANPLATDSQAVLTVERLMAIKGWIDELSDFVKNVYLIDVAAVGAFYPEWTQIGKGITNYLSVPDIPLDGKGTQFALPGGTRGPEQSHRTRFAHAPAGRRHCDTAEWNSALR